MGVVPARFATDHCASGGVCITVQIWPQSTQRQYWTKVVVSVALTALLAH